MKKTLQISSVLLLVCGFHLCSLADSVITGRVINQTLSQPSAGDHVILLRLGQGMETESETTTDARGAFSLPVSVANASHLLRVVHQGVNYDQPLKGRQSIEIHVFDAVPRVSGLSATVGMAQLETDGSMLKVTEMYDVLNASQPPVTQAKARNFEFSISADATLDSFQAKRAGGVWVNLNVSAISGRTGRYAVDFPLRPGDTLFRYIYRVPHSGSLSFRLRPAYPVKNFAVALPPTMTFTPLRSSDFTSPGIARGLRFEQAVSRTELREIPAFEISGMGNSTLGLAPSAPSSGVSADMASPPAAIAGSLPASTDAQSKSALSLMWPLPIAFACLLATALFGFFRRKRQYACEATGESRENNNAGLLHQ